MVQSEGIQYADLSAVNRRDSIGLYEVTGRFRLAQWHDANSIRNGKFTGNSADFLMVEAGYQNNSGLTHLIASSPQTNIRNRLVGRFYIYPEINSPTRTKLMLGVEYSGGLNGGPRDIRIVYGTTMDPARLIHPNNP
jgi:hypothetical protein